MGQKYATVEVRQKLAARLNEISICKGNTTAWNAIQNKEEFLKNETTLKETLTEVTPPDLSGKEKDSCKGRLMMIQEALVKGKDGLIDPMPSHRQCWDNAPGTAGQILRWGNFWKKHNLDPQGHVVKAERGKGAIWEAKDLMRALRKEAESEDPDIASLETIRPMNDSDPLSEVRRRSYGFSPTFKENYDEVFPNHPKTDVEEKVEVAANEQVEALMQRIAELEAQLPQPKPPKPINTAARAAASERMKAMHAARRAAKQAQQAQGA